MFAKAIAAALFLISAFAYSADIRVHQSKQVGPDSCWGNMLVLSGEIAQGDYIKLSNALAQIKGKYPKDECLGGILSIQLVSAGGDVDEALKLGRIIRQSELRVIVPLDSKCFSSCVLLIAGGVERALFGKVGIHRPYFVNLDSKLSQSEVKAQRDAINGKIKAYLNEMDISPNLLELMLSVPPEAMKILTEGELQQLRLSITDAAFDERQVATQAYRYGLTSSEYRTRYPVATQQCSKSNANWFVCELAVLLNIPKSTAEKLNRLLDRCDDDKMTVRESDECARKIFMTRQ